MYSQKGFTLIELMIASLIGITILTGVLNVFITTNRNISLSDALTQNQETGRFGMDYLTKNIRKAGYSEDHTIYNAPALLVPNGQILCISGDEAEACAANNPTTARGDQLSIPFVVNIGDEVTSCTGSIIGDDAADPQIAANVFWVSNDTDTNRELRCRTYDIDNSTWFDTSVSIIDNVEAFEFQVGLAADASSKSAARYVSVDTIDGVNNTVSMIRAIRIMLLTTSQDSLKEAANQTVIKERIYSLMDAPYREITDGKLRTIFSNTIELPSLIESANAGS